MPLYEYRCASCGHRFEVLQRMGDDASGLACPRCEATAVARQLSTFAAAVGGRTTSAGADAGGCGRVGCGTGFT